MKPFIVTSGKKQQNSDWYKYLRQASNRRRKRNRSNDSRGIMRGKRSLEDRPAGCLNRSRAGHFEVDTVWGKGSMYSILTIVDRKTGMLFIRKMKKHSTEETNKALLSIINQEKGKIKVITANNGTEFHQFKEIEVTICYLPSGRS